MINARIVRTAVATLALTAATAAQAGELSSIDRQRLVAHLEMTSSWLIDEVSGLSRAQLEFRSAPGAWTISETLEHVVMVAQIYWDDLQKAVKSPPGGGIVANRDVDILWYGIDRTHREAAIVTETPKEGVRDLSAALAAYRKHHARLLSYARTTADDLRSHYVPRQGSDAYQWALLISTHEQRHILQIREIKSNPRFPRN